MVGCAMQTVQVLFESNSFPLPGLLQGPAEQQGTQGCPENLEEQQDTHGYPGTQRENGTQRLFREPSRMIDTEDCPRDPAE